MDTVREVPSYDELLFDVRRSRVYHDKRLAFFEALQRLKSLVEIVFSSAAVVAFLSQGPPAILLASGLCVGVLAAYDLVLNLTAQTQKHLSLRNRYILLERELVGEESPDDAKVRGWHQELLTIEIDEPPVMCIVNLLAQNEVAMVYGREMYRIPWYRRFSAHFASSRGYVGKTVDSNPELTA